MLTFYNQYKSDTYSQNGEDGILAEILKRIFPENHCGTCVEFGAGDGRTHSNTALLIEQGWTGVMIEADTNLYTQCKAAWANRKNVLTLASLVTPESVNMVVPAFTDVLSIDIDGDDYNVWKALKHKPAVVIIEINSSIDPMADHVSIEKGSNFSAMVKLGKEKDYALLCHTGNLIFISNDVIAPYDKAYDIKNPLENITEYFNTTWYSGPLEKPQEQPAVVPPTEIQNPMNLLAEVQSRQLEQNHKNQQQQQREQKLESFLKEILQSTVITTSGARWEPSLDKITELQNLLSNPY